MKYACDFGYSTIQSGGVVCSNNTPLDIFGLYREVIKCGGLVRNERYDESNRWCGNINFAGSIFPNMRNYTPNHKATSIGNQLLSNYKKFLYEYEKCYAPRDLLGMPLDEVSYWECATSSV